MLEAIRLLDLKATSWKPFSFCMFDLLKVSTTEAVSGMVQRPPGSRKNGEHGRSVSHGSLDHARWSPGGPRAGQH